MLEALFLIAILFTDIKYSKNKNNIIKPLHYLLRYKSKKRHLD